MSDTAKTTFHTPIIGDGFIRLRLRERGHTGQLRAYLRGVSLGDPVTYQASESHVDLPVSQIPHVKLPADIRIGWEDGTDASPPLTIRSETQASALAGSGDLLDLNVSFTHGQVRGTARNPINGLTTPMIIGRINGNLMRHVRADVVAPHPEGGSIVTFDMAVDANDFTGEGGVIELLLAPSMKTLWRHALGPVGEQHQEAIKVLRQAASIEHTIRTSLADVQARLEQRMTTQSQLFEDVVTYLLALIHDRAATTQNDSIDREMARALLAKASPATAPSPDQVAVVGVSSPFIGAGWSAPILTEHRLEVRRFRTAATVLNPCPQRSVSKIIVTAIEANPDTLIQLRALIDAEPAHIKLSGVEAAPCSLVITADTQKGEGPFDVGLLTLLSPSGENIISVQDVRFHFSDAL